MRLSKGREVNHSFTRKETSRENLEHQKRSQARGRARGLLRSRSRVNVINSDSKKSRVVSVQRENVGVTDSKSYGSDAVTGNNEYVPMLNKVMNLTYMSSKVIRGRKSLNIGTTKKRINDANPRSSVENTKHKDNQVTFRGNFFTFTPEIYNDMNLSYMNSNTFRSDNSRSFEDNSYIKPKQVLRKRKRVLTELPRSVSISNTNTIKHDSSQQQNDYKPTIGIYFSNFVRLALS